MARTHGRQTIVEAETIVAFSIRDAYSEPHGTTTSKEKRLRGTTACCLESPEKHQRGGVSITVRLGWLLLDWRLEAMYCLGIAIHIRVEFSRCLK